MIAPLEELESRLGYSFANRSLLLRALTHKSLPSELVAGASPPESDNEQLEFLGDAILGFLSSDYLLQRCPGYPEGKLSRLKAHIVSSSHLYEIAQTLELGMHLRLGKGEELSGGRSKRALLANAVEAVIAALYLDGGLAPCRSFLDRYAWAGLPLNELADPHVPMDAKSALQELAQARHLPVPRYVIVREKGPDHSKTFTVEARVGKDFVAHADGSSKRIAGQRAAELVLQQLEADVQSLD